MKITSKIATVTLLALATNMSVFAMTRNDFDNGMAKGINYFNQGLYYEAKDEFQWFCDANWGSMNAGQPKYALDYLGGAKARIRKWEQSLQERSADWAIGLVKNEIGSYANEYNQYIYNCYDKGSYYLVNAAVTRNANGISKYRVYKYSNYGNYIEYIGAGSEWSMDSEETACK